MGERAMVVGIRTTAIAAFVIDLAAFRDRTFVQEEREDVGVTEFSAPEKWTVARLVVVAQPGPAAVRPGLFDLAPKSGNIPLADGRVALHDAASSFFRA